MIKSWMVIGAVTFLVALASNILRPKDVKWFARLRRPRWLTFEPLIPLIWIVILIAGAWSAYIVWERDPGSSKAWSLMIAYLLLELAIVLYSPVTLWLRSLKAGTLIGGIGVVIGLVLTFTVWQVSRWAALLLVPYLLWSPIGTYTTWVMGKLNPESA
ncbi:TspO/MBR family protein [Phormidium sp. FACHB-592]|uniref:TspO/MBR family protein n=1 Tax=Stenomitos frigidus AS-A4 TaxID=2933935 RepID=A0ABV0KFR8_9CYAN|nr:TspO/MBR family protein [Phormidium sp. FACHB-592]MBD2076673.1 TspO/MBR family protein [Phormidium sp. FACHB-592]